MILMYDAIMLNSTGMLEVNVIKNCMKQRRDGLIKTMKRSNKSTKYNAAFGRVYF